LLYSNEFRGKGIQGCTPGKQHMNPLAFVAGFRMLTLYM
jgi:hypothetical protein